MLKAFDAPTREVAAGNLSYKVHALAASENGTLVNPFHRVTDDLMESTHRHEEAYLDHQDKHTEELRRQTRGLLSGQNNLGLRHHRWRQDQAQILGRLQVDTGDLFSGQVAGD